MDKEAPEGGITGLITSPAAVIVTILWALKHCLEPGMP